MRHGKIYDLLPVICWHLGEAWQDVRFVAWDLVGSVRGMTRYMICCLGFASFCVRHGRIHDLLSVICWQGMETVTHMISCSILKSTTLNPQPLYF